LFGTQRHTHVMSAVLDEGLALFAGLNVIPKRSFLTEYSCRANIGARRVWKARRTSTCRTASDRARILPQRAVPRD